MKIIAFGHRREVGKTLAADFLFSAIKAKDPKIKIFKGGFADSVKEQAYNMFGWAGVHPAYYYENNPGSKSQIIPDLGLCARDVWIHVGEEIRRICPIVWVKLLMEKVPLDTEYCIIHDLRKFPETSFLMKENGFLIKMVRDVLEYGDPVDSELKDFKGWNSVVENNGSKADLMAKMNNLANYLVGK